MSSKFVQVDRETVYLLPPSIQDWLPENHMARFVVDIVSRLNLEALKKAYSGRGSKAYHPEMLLALLFYGYATGVFSSRKLERATYDSVAFRYVAANTHPDHDTISTFRKRFLKHLKPLFKEILEIAHSMEVLKLGKVSLDGTKMKANASKHRALSWDHACKLEKQLKNEVEELLRKAEEADKVDLPEGMSLSDELARRETRLKMIEEAKEEIKKRASERYAKEKEAYDKKVAEREKKEKSTGKKAKGRAPKQPDSKPNGKDQVNLTDSESRIMPKSGGGFEQAYNAQAGVDIKTMLIVEEHVTQNVNDKLEVEPALETLSSLPREMGEVDSLLADAGYFSETNVESCAEAGITPYIAPGREKHNTPLMDRFTEPPPLPDNPDAVETMRHRLKTTEGRKLYGKRKSTVEPVFGIIKSVMGFRQFLLRGFESVQDEWTLVCLSWNLKRLHAIKG